MMQLVQIGVPRQKTILDLIMEMSERQANEIQRLKNEARERARYSRRHSRQQSWAKQSNSSSS